MNSNEHGTQIALAPPDHVPEALRLVFRDLSEDEQIQQVETLLTHGRSGRVALDGLLEARRDGRLAGAQFWQILPGKTAVVWPPRVAAGEAGDLGPRLLEAACERMAAAGVCVAHVLLEVAGSADDAVLRGGGFHSLADLLYLVSLEPEFPATQPSSPLDFEPYTAQNHQRLAALVEATYVQTLDCPQLNDVRAMEDVLEGYRATGVFDPGRWLIVRHEGRDVGCLILADHPEHGNWELVYMGLIPAVRGNGWGMDIARYGQWRTGQAGRPRMVLAVDAENAPAIAMYSAVGFRAWDRRSVYVRVL